MRYDVSAMGCIILFFNIDGIALHTYPLPTGQNGWLQGEMCLMPHFNYMFVIFSKSGLKSVANKILLLFYDFSC